MRRLTTTDLAAFVLCLLLLVTAVAGGPFWAHIAILSFLWAANASAWNLIGGFGGQMSLGHAAFFGIGAYTSTLLFLQAGISPWIGMWIGAVLGGLAAVIVGIPTFRLRGPYFALGTFALGTVIMLLATQWRGLTRGSVGIPIGFQPGLANLMFREKWPYALIGLGLLALNVICAELIRGSKLGYQLAAIREDEQSAQALGINTAHIKLVAAATSGALTALCGTFYAQYILYIDPNSVFGSVISIHVLLLTIIGGIGTVSGPVLGALLLTPLTQLLLGRFGGSLPGLHTLLFGATLVLIVLFAPGGLDQALRKLRLPARRRVQKGVRS